MSEQPDGDRPAEDAPRSEEAKYKAFVGGIPYAYEDRDLEQAFRKYNPTGALVMVDKRLNRSRGFGFVMFGDEQNLLDAIKEMAGTELDGKRISVNRAVPQDQTAPGVPASSIAAGRYFDRPRNREPPRSGGGGGGYERGGYDRGGYDRGGYDRGGYDRGGYGGGGGGYRDPYYDRAAYDQRAYYGGYAAAADPYYRDPYGRAAYGYDAHGYAAAGYNGAAGGYDDRDRYAAAGPDRRAAYDRAPRPGPYDRDAGRRDDAAPRR